MRSRSAGAVLVLLLLSGCLGGGSSNEGLPSASDDPSSPTMSNSASPPQEKKDEFVPKFHAHNYWNERTEVFLFSEWPLKIGEDPQKETKIVGTSTVIVGYREFDTRSNGEQVSTPDGTDTVFQGTREVRVKLEWLQSDQIKGLTFYYKTAAGPQYAAIEKVTSGAEYVIPVKKGMADMPHQLELSRWRFRVEAYDPTFDPYPVKLYLAKGTIKVTMRIINGGETAIDPPHPYFFTKSPTRYAGEINRTIATTVLVNASTPVASLEQHPLVGSSPFGWEVENRHIIPWETTKLRVWLHYNYTGASKPVVEHKLGLRFSDSSGPEIRYPNAASNDGALAYYEIPIAEVQTDSPYAQKSDWKWGVYPIIQGQEDNGGDFEGNVHIVLQAVKEGDTADRGMGN